MKKIKKSTKCQLKEGKMRVSRVVTTAILVLMLTAVMGLRNAEAQTPLACDAIPFTDGWLSMTVSNPTGLGAMAATDVQGAALMYSAGMLGTVENFGGNAVAGLDWLYDDRQPNLETNMVGTQLVSWWTRKDGRNTILQATNTNPDTTVVNTVSGALEGNVTVHVQILGEDCLELRNFCDSYTPLDTVVYDFSNMVSNVGQTINVGNLAEREGIVVITPVDTCAIAAPPTFDAVSWNFLQGNVRIINEGQDWEYGSNVRARTASPAQPYMSSGAPDRNFVFDYYSAVQGDPCVDDGCVAESLFKDFNSVGTNPGSDLVLMSFGDYGLCGSSPTSPSFCAMGKADQVGGALGSPGIYSAGPLASASQFGPFAIFDDAENPESCPAVLGCFRRIGVDEGIPSTDDVTPDPPIDTCPFIDGVPDCSNPLCKTSEAGCENTEIEGQEGFCSDGIDNDGVDGTDCEDFGCDGSIGDSETGAICQTGQELTCNDGFDNDANGQCDCGDLTGVEPCMVDGVALPADQACIDAGACGAVDGDDGGDSGDGGCTVAAGPVSGTSSAANFLLPLLPLAGVFAVRRMIRRRK